MDRAQPLPARRLALGGFVLLFALLQIALAFTHNINWDEYYFLNHVYAAQADRLAAPFQTFYVHLLFWLPRLPLTEPDQIVAGRLLMMLCEAGSLACLFAIARRIAGVDAALAVVAVWCASGFALVHGASFRADPLAAVFLMASLALLFDRKAGVPRAILAGVLAALGLLVTVKGAFYLPAFAAAFAWSCGGGADARRAFVRFGAAAVALMVVYLALWSLHSGGLVHSGAASTGGLGGAVAAGGGAFEKTVGSQTFFPRADAVRAWAALGPASLALVALGFGMALWRLVRGEARHEALVVLLCALPLLSLAFYRNAFPYFFPFVMFPAALVAIFPMKVVLARPGLAFWAVLTLLGIGLGAQFARGWGTGQDAQRATAAAAHALFPRPVAYIDRNAMLPSFPHSGFFMSSWGLESVLAGGHPILAPAIERDAPPLLIANSPVIEAALDPADRWPGPRLLPADARALRDNYLHHWGAIWVAGKDLANARGSFDLAIPGAYTFECSGERTLDEERVACDSVVMLARGTHRWSGGPLRLRWGRYLPVPASPAPDGPIYYGF